MGKPETPSRRQATQ